MASEFTVYPMVASGRPEASRKASVGNFGGVGLLRRLSGGSAENPV